MKKIDILKKVRKEIPKPTKIFLRKDRKIKKKISQKDLEDFLNNHYEGFKW